MLLFLARISAPVSNPGVRSAQCGPLPSVSPTEDRARFTAMFHALSPRVFAYARRQCDAATAEDVVSETFMVAWRRFEDLPADPLPWLLVIARNTLSDRRRRTLRADRLTDTIAGLEQTAGHATAADHDVIERASAVAALAELSNLEREALLLVAWDGLSNTAAAVVAGCTQRAFEVRLSRARARLTRAMTTSSTQSQIPIPLHPRGDCTVALRKATT